ncbi:hypothetical protein DFQ27_009056 [Actinomortierella ambigua]|uniref:Suppressor of white apricot N-terminal domain-containing protein n=1 Tax=Actinomortierella ambigua TaxID=1343610 RepID=A0A9P6QLM9_9FUNG|nr:hypothetical protein DFQ27_009056 [Actinomortierella ambigua]
MPCSLNPAVKIDRFDGRALLDYLPFDTPAMLAASQKQERDEDGLGNELQFERYHDLLDKIRLHVSEEQCLADNEEEWNELVARHNAIIGKQTADKKPSPSAASFGFNYGTKVMGDHDNDEDAQAESATTGSLIEREPTALEEENILDHLTKLSALERDHLDEMATPFGIKNYFQLLKVAKRDQESRVRQLKVTALNLERTMMGKKPLKQSEIDEILGGEGSEEDNRDGAGGQSRQGRGRRRQRRRRHRRHTSRSRSPHARSSRRDSPSYEPYGNASSSSHSGSESDASSSPQPVKEEFISEFKIGGSDPQYRHHYSERAAGGDVSSDPDTGSNPYYDDEPTTQAHAKPLKPLTSSATTTSAIPTATSKSGGPAKKATLSLAEKLRQRMRQGLDQSIKSNELKKQTKERELELERARENDELYASSILRGQFPSLAASIAPTSKHGDPWIIFLPTHANDDAPMPKIVREVGAKAKTDKEKTLDEMVRFTSVSDIRVEAGAGAGVEAVREEALGKARVRIEAEAGVGVGPGLVQVVVEAEGRKVTFSVEIKVKVKNKTREEEVAKAHFQ